ncbi:hypothetical protein GGI35DRAFT_287145 [Trichoderma velutinum]
MRYLLPAVLGALSLIYVDGVAAQDVPTCVPGCANTVRGQFAQYGCVSADDAACLCANANFGFGVRDCGQNGCGSTDVQIQAFLAGSFCQGQQLAFTPSGAPPTSPPTATPSPSESTPPPSETTPSPTSPPPTSAPSSETAPPSSSPPATGPPTTASSATTGPASVPTHTSAPSTGTPLHSNSTIPASKPTSPPPTTTSAASFTSTSATSSATASETSAAAPAGGLSQGAAIGIGVGVAGGVVAIAFAGVFFFLKNRSRTHDSFDISAPPPSSGRGQGAFEKYSNDLELVSNRYEDMVPRQQPRAMV